MEGRVFLFVLDRGFVVVGRSAIDTELAFHWRVRGRTVRRWGTTDGLSQLCGGPTGETILDPVCWRRVPFRSVIEIIEVEEEKWTSHLS